MKKRNRFFEKILLLICMSGLLAGCGKKDSFVDNGQEESKSTGMLWVASLNATTYGSRGVFCDESNYIYFLDAATGVSDIICDDATCSHTKEKCSAYFDGVTYTALYGEHLLLVTAHGADKVGDMYLYEADVNGTNRRKLAYLGNMQLIFQLLFTEDFIVIAYCNSYDENLEPMEEFQSGIYVYDRKTNCGEVIWEKKALDSMVPKFVYHDNEVYFYSIYYDVTPEELPDYVENGTYTEAPLCVELCRVNVKDKTVSLIQENLEDTGSLAVCQNRVWYSCEDALWYYDIVTGEKGEALSQTMQALDAFGLDELLLRKGSDYFVYHPDTGLRKIATRENIGITAVFPDITYALDYNTETGNGETVYWNTKDFLCPEN